MDPNLIKEELEAMTAVAAILAPLDPVVRSRVLDWASQFRAPVYRKGPT